MSETLAFGPFTLIAHQRLLLRDGVPVELGARAFDLLVALASRPNEIVGKAELLAWVWPDVTVEEGSLRFHVANLRKALGDGQDGTRYIATLTGRGYCFVAPLSRTGRRDDRERAAAPHLAQATLPARLSRIVGRREEATDIQTQLKAARFLTIVGMGGVGKTTLAVAVGHDLVETFDGAVHFVDLSALDEPELVATTVASMLGLTLEPDDVVAGLIAFLAGKRSCLILDTCEHVIEAAAGLAARLFQSVPSLSILATSREPLQVEGERVYRLAPLACPPDDPGITAAQLQDFPAAQLFLERAGANGADFDVADEDAAMAADICRRLDGVPLAIELAAGRVASFGLGKTATLLDERLSLLWSGPRTAPARQKTLQATLDWSYDLLTETESLVLRRLAIFVGSFSIDAVLAVVTSATIDEALVFGAIDSLVAKSMVATRPAGATMRYRLLDTTRAYVLQRDTHDDERGALADRHASHYLRWLDETGAEWPSLSSVTQRSRHLAGLANVRAALEWCFSPSGAADLGIRMVVAAAPVLLSMSLLTECHRWTARAIVALDEAARGSREEMHLQAALGVSLMFTRGGQDAALAALERSLAIAEASGTVLDRIQVLGPLQMFRLRRGAFRTALAAAERCSDLAGQIDDPVSLTLANALTGISLHLDGELGRAQIALESAVRTGASLGRTTTHYLGFDGRLLSSAILARNIWLLGHPDRAIERAFLTIADAEALDHPLTLAITLVWVVSMFLWIGDLDQADQLIDRLFARARLHSLGPYLAVGRGFQGEIAIRRGDAEAGMRCLQQSLAELHAAPYELLTTPLAMALVQGLAATRRFDEAEALLGETIGAVETNGDRCYVPELLRVKAGLLISGSRPAREEAETCLLGSLAASRSQGARAWELRSAVDLASLYVARGQRDNADALLRPLVERFTEGLATSDLEAAIGILSG